ncbi:NAD/NADP octopine/nopaline dehydrogenase, alpha-helical domain containing protein [Nitzschia inconspicua]|uniref:NAD/NADP octopine/nopaline dehydrogenase, alpha-helical domain containing protein n=1 Tax=Nitzschia inconspicua TaxID=303405 RepID=A0A9K3M3X6_9STRA|nr:NAD/NADP octopine/nopaline dehydrogenase, alpha-helical domain containing protein [Nitzschia inconspicua]
MSKKILLCGGGNAIHVLTSLIGSRPDCDVSIFSTFPGEADRIRDAIPEEGIQCVNDLGEDKYGKPVKVSDKAEEVVPGSDIIILAIPSFTHELYLRAVAPFVKPGVIIGAMPGEGGFDCCARHVLGADFVNQSNLFALETLPWACRILEYGKKVEVLGTKKEIDVVVTEGKNASAESVLELLQTLIGRLPVLKPACNFLAVTLMNINSVWHPTISYSFYRNWDGQPFDEPPLFYYGADEYTGEKLAKVSDEVLNIRAKIQEKYPDLDLSSLHHVRDWMLMSYGDDIGDKTSIYTMLTTNKGYRGLTHPTQPIETADGTTKHMPNFKYRYFSEDIPMGLCVTRGIAELAGVPTPNMDDVIIWCQSVMGKEYLVDGKFVGKDIAGTRSPQAYGFFELDEFLRANNYV